MKVLRAMNAPLSIAFQQRGSKVGFQRKTFCLSIIQSSLEISMDPFQLTSQSNVSKFHHWKPFMAANDGNFTVLAPIIWSPQLGHPLKLEKVCIALGFHITPSHFSNYISLAPTLSLHHPNSYALFPSPPVPSSPPKFILLPFLRQIHMFPLEPP